jgi:hypothetical protein
MAINESGPRRFQASAAFRELLDVLRDADAIFLDGPRAVPDDVSVMEGYRWLTEVLGVALDCYLMADPARPHFVALVSPTRKFGGDNADAFYYFAPVDPTRTYRIRGRKGDAVYLSLCVYGGPTDGRWSNRIVSSINDRQMTIAPDGTFDIIASPTPQPGNWLALEPDAVALVTRDYVIDPTTARKAVWHIEAVDAVSPPPLLTDGELSRRLHCTANFIRDLLNICPLPPAAESNVFMDPYKQQAITYGWAAPDATYCMGRYELADDEALIIEGRSPRCVFWNLCLWNPYLQTYDYRYERVTINGGQVRYEPDGSWKIVIAARDPGMPNWLSTAGHPRGVLWFRWFLAEEMPARPQARVIKHG